MPDILTITANPAVDLATSVERVIDGPKLYCRAPRLDPGGGGVNVARAICRLGGQATALVTVGGAMGDRNVAMLKSEGVPVRPVAIHGETRQSFAVTDESDGRQFRFSLPGETLTRGESDRLLREISGAAPVDGFVVLSGGVAPGLSDDFPRQVQSAIAHRTDRLIVDTSKAPLTQMIAAPASPVLLLRMDQKEAAQLVGHTIEDTADCVAFGLGLVRRGVARMVVLGRGALGSVLVTDTERVYCHAPSVPVVSKIGAGDAMVGAMTLALARGEPNDHALRFGVAAASATVMTEGTGLCEQDQTARLFQDCVLEAV